MKIKNFAGLSSADLKRELEHGGKFVLYDYSISIVVMTFRQSSDIYFIRSNENAVVKGLGFTLISLLLGWWGIPWGPIYTVGALYRNLSGGKNVTAEVVEHLINTMKQENAAATASQYA